MKLPDFEYRLPETLDEAVALLAESEESGSDAKILAGGQSLLPMMAYRVVRPDLLVDLRKIPDLDRITIGSTVNIGARVTWSAIERDKRLKTAHPLLQEMVRNIAHHQIRTRGTAGGSLAHADPAAEFPAVAIGCGASVNVIGSSGSRTIAIDEFLLAPLFTALEENEIITSIDLPPWKPGRRFALKEFCRRQGDFAIAGAVVQFDLDADRTIRDCSITGFGLGDVPVRLVDAEDHLEGRTLEPDALEEAARLGAASAEVDSDPQASAEYRRALLEAMLSRALSHAAAG